MRGEAGGPPTTRPAEIATSSFSCRTHSAPPEPAAVRRSRRPGRRRLGRGRGARGRPGRGAPRTPHALRHRRRSSSRAGSDGTPPGRIRGSARPRCRRQRSAGAPRQRREKHLHAWKEPLHQDVKRRHTSWLHHFRTDLLLPPTGAAPAATARALLLGVSDCRRHQRTAFRSAPRTKSHLAPRASSQDNPTTHGSRGSVR
mmetsp:Transcript_41762/g.135067  ORF Transcript_41762/g.135067 Transcript_41762/m.135067 type:complete len:200 (-) Transcript_41762:444-1043(-)